MAQLFEHIIQSINNSELRISIEKLFDILGVGTGDKKGSVSLSGTLTGDVTGDVTGDLTGDVTGTITDDNGTFTPVVADAASDGNVAVVTSAVGRYVKVGKSVLVTITIEGIDTTGLTGGNVLFIRDLPFFDVADIRHYGAITPVGITFTGYLTVQTGNASVDYINLIDNTSAGSPAGVTVAGFASGASSVRATIVYEVA